MKFENGIRLGIGFVLLNSRNRIFVAQRADSPFYIENGVSKESFQLPQGGIDDNESPVQALWREMYEEIGTKKAHILKESEGWFTYTIPEDLRKKIWDGQYHSQRQKWFLLRFLGKDTDFNLHSHTSNEFISWKWIDRFSLVDFAIDFKKELYRSILDIFF